MMFATHAAPVTQGQDRIGYFGKIASRSDFVKAAHDVSVIGVLDDWLAQVMAALLADARWKLNYDALAPLHFAFVGPRRKRAIAGHIVASRDQSGRRYPFLLARTLDVSEPASFVARCPIVLELLWANMQVLGAQVLKAADPGAPLQAILDAEVAVDEASGAALGGFMAASTLASLSGLLGRLNVRQLILALGLLLEPALHGGVADLDKSLVLPLPENVYARQAVAAFWLELIVPFLGQADLELALFIATIEHRPVLVLGCRGASIPTLRAIIDPLFAAGQQVDFADSGWVDTQAFEPEVRALSSYLEQPQLPLSLARELFLQTFIGAKP